MCELEPHASPCRCWESITDRFSSWYLSLQIWLTWTGGSFAWNKKVLNLQRLAYYLGWQCKACWIVIGILTCDTVHKPLGVLQVLVSVKGRDRGQRKASMNLDGEHSPLPTQSREPILHGESPARAGSRLTCFRSVCSLQIGGQNARRSMSSLDRGSWVRPTAGGRGRRCPTVPLRGEASGPMEQGGRRPPTEPGTRCTRKLFQDHWEDTEVVQVGARTESLKGALFLFEFALCLFSFSSLFFVLFVGLPPPPPASPPPHNALGRWQEGKLLPT